MKIAHIIQVKHRDEVEAPLTDWLREAYDFEPVAKTIKAHDATARQQPSARKRQSRKRRRRNSKLRRMKYLCLVYLEGDKLHAVPDRECFNSGDGLQQEGPAARRRAAVSG